MVLGIQTKNDDLGKESNRMKSCTMSMLPSVYSECCSELPKHVQDIHQKLEDRMNAFFEDSPQQEIIIQC